MAMVMHAKLLVRMLLGAFMTFAGVTHLTVARQEFIAQVPTWLQFSEGFTDFVVLASGVVEIVLGLAMLFLWRKKALVGTLLALFYIAIFPATSTNMQITSVPLALTPTNNAWCVCSFSLC